MRTYFVYSDEGLVGEYSDAGTEIKSYGYKPGSTWTTDPLFVKEVGQHYFYQNDHLGTPQKMKEVNGAVVWLGRYSSFGEAEIETGSKVTNNLRFAGQYFDQEAGLHYNYNRYYNPKYGRYLKTDPIGLFADVAIADFYNHLFVYAGNNPINLRDPIGEFPVHGNFCGPGHGDLIREKPWPKRRDGGLDRCCYNHDLGYKKYGMKKPYGQVWCDEGKSAEQISCDRKLCSCLEGTSPPLKYLHKKYAMQKAFGCIKPGNIIEIHF